MTVYVIKSSLMTVKFGCRKITYLLGDDDTLDNAHLDKSCAAEAQVPSQQELSHMPSTFPVFCSARAYEHLLAHGQADQCKPPRTRLFTFQQNSSSIEAKCVHGCMQGADRKQRGLVFFQYLKLNAPNITSSQQAVIVPNCGHNESCIFNSAQFLSAWGFVS